MNSIVQYQESRALTAADMRAQVNLVQEVMKAVMQGPSKENPAGVHYGTIPGTPKPTLYKAGAEVLGATFRIAVSYSTEDLSTADVVRYRVAATGTHQTTGIIMGAGMGECSSGEEKYKWRKASGDKEYNATPEDRKRIKYGKDWTTKQVRTEPADLANTVLKMACKRAQVAMILNVTAASDIFTQDIEDLPEELRHDESEHREPQDTGPKPYDPEQFKKNLPAWTNLIKTGKKTAEQIIATVNSKAVLSDEQKKTIMAVKKDEAPEVSFDAVYAKIQNAEDEELLALARDLIREVKDEQQRKDLSQFADTRQAGFQGAR